MLCCQRPSLGYFWEAFVHIMETTQLQAVSEKSDPGIIKSVDLKWENSALLQ